MTDQPLQPFSLPNNLLSQLHLSGVLSGGSLIMWLFYIVFIFWALYTLVAIYHWIKYSHASLVAFPAIAVHLFISFALFSYTLSGHGLFLSPPLP
jgi:hypothetical protein